jgi:hypothetical protein
MDSSSSFDDPPVDPRATPLERYVAELVALGGPLTSIVDHMQRNGGTPASIPEVLRGLLGSTLSPLTADHDDATLDAAAALLHDTCEIVCAEILLVPLNRQARRAARRRSGCG